MGYNQKSYLDFYFNGKWASDFGLVVVSSGDRLSLQVQPQFTINTMTVPGKDGLINWGTQKTNGNVNFSLATDGITARQFEELKAWLEPGIIGQLVFAELPYKYYSAAIQAPATFSFVPFDTVTTLFGEERKDIWYKGTVNFSFILYDITAYTTTFEEEINPSFIDSTQKAVIKFDENYDEDYYAILVTSLDTTYDYDAVMYTDFDAQDDYVYINDINFLPVIEDWWPSSGIPLQSTLITGSSGSANTDKYIYIANNFRGNNDTMYEPSDTTMSMDIATSGKLYCYNGGTAKALANVIFTKTVTKTRDIDNWTNITFTFDGKTATMGRPRILSDIRYTFDLLDNYSSTSAYMADKAIIQQDLLDNLHGTLKKQIMGILRLTGTGLQWTSLSAARSAISGLVNNKAFTFSINAQKQQCVLNATLDLWSFGLTTATLIEDQLVEENFGDVFNNNYIYISGAKEFVNKLDIQEISVTGGPITNILVYFKYTYA